MASTAREGQERVRPWEANPAPAPAVIQARIMEIRLSPDPIKAERIKCCQAESWNQGLCGGCCTVGL